MNEYYVYVHLRASTGEPFYYGKGKGRRAWHQIRNAWHSNVARKHGLVVKLLQQHLSHEDAKAAEIRLIAEARCRGENITNMTPGGDGVGGEGSRRGGKKGGCIVGAKTYANGTGVHGRSMEQKITDGRKGGLVAGRQNAKLKRGICGLSNDARIRICSIAGKIGGPIGGKITGEENARLKRGALGASKEQLSKWGTKGVSNRNNSYCAEAGRKTSSQRIKCLSCGRISSPGGIGKHQKDTGHIGKEKLNLDSRR